MAVDGFLCFVGFVVYTFLFGAIVEILSTPCIIFLMLLRWGCPWDHIGKMAARIYSIQSSLIKWSRFGCSFLYFHKYEGIWHNVPENTYLPIKYFSKAFFYPIKHSSHFHSRNNKKAAKYHCWNQNSFSNSISLPKEI